MGRDPVRSRPRPRGTRKAGERDCSAGGGCGCLRRRTRCLCLGSRGSLCRGLPNGPRPIDGLAQPKAPLRNVLKKGPYRKTAEVITDGTPAHSPEPVPELVRLSRLADAHPLDEFSNPTGAAHRQLIDIMRRLAREPRARRSVARMGLGDGLNERQGALLDRVGGATAGRFIDLEKAEAVLAESQRRRRMSLGWWVGGDGITKCRS